MTNSTIKQAVLILALLLVSTVFDSTAYAKNKNYKGEVESKFNKKQQIGDSLFVDVSFDLNDFKVNSNRSVNYTIVINNEMNMLKVPILSFKGCNNYRTYKINRSVKSKTGNKRIDSSNKLYKVIKQSKKSSDVVFHDIAIAYQNWFENANVFLEKNVGYCGKEYFLASKKMGSISLETPFLPYLEYIEPDVEVKKHRNSSIVCLINFEQGSSVLDDTYKDNELKLALINQSIDSIILDKYSLINNIYLTGYASPEGNIKNNEILAKSRALSLLKYVNKNNLIKDSICSVKFGGEDWDGLKEAIKKSDLPRKEEILLMLDFEQDANKRTELLKGIGDGTVYEFLLNKVYPKLRKVVVDIDYEIELFDLKRAKAVILYRPQNLSLNEMYDVANSYEVGSAEFNNVFNIAAKTFPVAPIANLNAAIAGIKEGNLELAESYLSVISPQDYTKEYYNAKGIIEVMKGNLDSAEDYFENSYGAGLKIALKNLKQVRLMKDME